MNSPGQPQPSPAARSIAFTAAAMSSWPRPWARADWKHLADGREARHRRQALGGLGQHQGLVLHEQVDGEVLLEVPLGHGLALERK